MPLRSFEYLVKIVESGSINHAAQALGMDQQRLRGALNSLENKLGITLVRRTKQGVHLTEEGQAMWQDIVLLAGISQKWRTPAGKKLQASTVRVATSPFLQGAVLREVMTIKRNAPHVAIDILEAGFEDIIPLILKERIPGLISSLATARAESYRSLASAYHMNMEVLRRDDFHVILNRDHPLARHEALCRDELGGFIPAMYPHAESNFQYGDILSFFAHPVLHVTKLESILHLVEEDPNIATIFPAGVLFRESRKQSLVSLPVSDFPMPGQLCLFFPDEEHITPAEKRAVTLLRRAAESFCPEN